MSQRSAVDRRVISGIIAVAFCSTLIVAVSARAVEPQRRPNVLFIVVDDLNNHVAPYGHPIKTPNFERLAARGVRFDHAYCQYPLCNPSRSSFLSGRRPTATQISDNNTHPRTHLAGVPFLPEHFQAHGYRTSRVGKISHNTFEASVRWGSSQSTPVFSPSTEVYFESLWEGGESKRPQTDPLFMAAIQGMAAAAAKAPENLRSIRDPGIYPDWPVAKLLWFLATCHSHAREGEGGDEPDRQASDQLVKLIGERGDQPFFIGAGFYRPHLPWVAPQKYFDLYPPDRMALPREPSNDRDDIPTVALSPLGLLASNPQTPEEARKAIQAYYASISFTDEQLGRLLDALDQHKLWDDTIVVLFGDHGYHLGEHHGLWHKLSLFEESVRVPLLVVAPGKKSGASSQRFVELVDLYPTLCELAGLTPPDGLEGTSFAALLDNPQLPWKEAAFSEVLRPGNVLGRTVRTERYRYTEWGGPQTAELYDHQHDPQELTNRIGDPQYAQARAELQKRLQQGSTRGRRQRPLSASDSVVPSSSESLRATSRVSPSTCTSRIGSPRQPLATPSASNSE